MLLFKTILIVIFGCFRPIWANLKPCSDSEDTELEICLTGTGKYRPPFPLIVETRQYPDIGHEQTQY